MFIKVKIDNLNEFSNSIPDKLRREVKIKREILKNTYKNLYRNKFKQYGESNVSYFSFKKEVL